MGVISSLQLVILTLSNEQLQVMHWFVPLFLQLPHPNPLLKEREFGTAFFSSLEDKVRFYLYSQKVE